MEGILHLYYDRESASIFYGIELQVLTAMRSQLTPYVIVGVSVSFASLFDVPSSINRFSRQAIKETERWLS